MSAIEDRIITKFLELGSLNLAFKRKLDAEHFLDPDRRAIFQYMQQWWLTPSTARTLPTIGRIRKRWPSFHPTAADPNNDEELPTLISELKMRGFETDARGMAEYFLELVEENPIEAVQAMKAALRDLDIRTDEEAELPLNLQDIAKLAREQYEGAKSGALYGVPWPWKCLTEDTLGKRAGDFVVFYGRMKSMKTWILLFCAAMDFLLHKRRVLVWSREMSKLKLGLRMAALLAGADYHMFKAGALPPKLEERTFKILDELGRKKSKATVQEEAERGVADLCLCAGRGAPKTLDKLEEIVKEFQPDVIYLDSFYHIDSSRSQGMTERWKRVSALAEDVKSWAEDIELPVVAVHQANRSGEKTYGNTLADLADADVIAREADLIIRVVVSPKSLELYEEEYEQEIERLVKRAKQVQQGPKHRPSIKLGKSDQRGLSKKDLDRLTEKVDARKGAELALVMGGNREGILEAFIIRAIPAYDFSLVNDRPQMKEIREWVKADDKKEDDAPPKTGKSETSKRATGKAKIDYAKSLANTKGEDWGAGSS